MSTIELLLHPPPPPLLCLISYDWHCSVLFTMHHSVSVASLCVSAQQPVWNEWHCSWEARGVWCPELSVSWSVCRYWINRNPQSEMNCSYIKFITCPLWEEGSLSWFLVYMCRFSFFRYVCYSFICWFLPDNLLTRNLIFLTGICWS